MKTVSIEEFKKKYQTSSLATTPQVQSGGVIQDLKETAGNLKNTFTSTFSRQKEALGASIDGKQSNVRGLAQAVGIGAGGLSNAIGDVVIGAGKAVLPQRAEEVISSGFQKVAEPIIQSEPVQSLISRYNSLDDKSKRDVDALLGVGSLVADLVGGIGGKQAARTTLKTGERAIGTAVDTGKTVGTRAANVGRKVGGEASESIKDFGVSQLTGLNPETVKTIVNNVDDFKKAREAGLNRFTVAKQVEEKLNQRLDELSEIGSRYETIRTSGEVVELPKNWLDQEITRQGFIVKDGKIRANTKSPTRDSNDLLGIQKIYEDWSGKSQLEADEFLNLRHDLSKISKFGKEVGRSDELENFARSARESLNRYREQVTGLKELDETFAPEKQVLENLKKEFLNADGELKDAAINRIANATGKGKDQLLDRLNELVPDIRERISLVKALEDVEYAKGQKVGAYTRSLLGGGLVLTGNIPAGLALITISSPNNVVRILEYYAKTIKPNQSKIIQSIKTKLQKGEKLNQTESSVMSEILNMSKETANSIVDAIGVGAGVGVVEGTKQQIP